MTSSARINRLLLLPPHIQSSCLRFRVNKRFVGVSIEACFDLLPPSIQPFCPQHRLNRRFAGVSMASMFDLLPRA
jgi:hypothetical protein